MATVDDFLQAAQQAYPVPPTNAATAPASAVGSLLAPMLVRPASATPLSPVAPTAAGARAAAAPAPAAPVAPAAPMPTMNAPTQSAPMPVAPPAPVSDAVTAAQRSSGGSQPAASPPIMNASPPVMSATPPLVGGGGLGSPASLISQGFDRQQAYAQNFLDQALNYIGQGTDIFDRATRGRAISGILHAVAGSNNEGNVQGAGANALNMALGGIAQAGIGANASMYGQNEATTRALAQIQNTQNIAQLDASQPRPTGQTLVYDPATRMNVPVTTYGLPVIENNRVVGSRPLTPNRSDSASARVVGATYTDANGNRATLQADGTYKPVQ